MDYSSGLELSKRRNGQRPSCEPCRLAKIKCDHAQPHCGRCVKRGFTERCFYHPAPLTCTDDLPQKKRRRKSSSGTHATEPLLQALTPTPKAIISKYNGDHDFDRATGLVGTSGLPFGDTNASFDALPRAFTSLTKTGVSCPSTAFRIKDSLIREGAVVLDFVLSSFRLLDPCFEKLNEERGAGFCGNRVLTQIIWAAVGSANELLRVENGGSVLDLYSLSRTIFETTSRPFQLPERLSERGIADVVLGGSELRWETIGLFCCLISRPSYAQEKQSQLVGQSSTWKPLMKEAVEHCLQCERFCDRMDQVNDLTVQLLVHACCVPTWCYGDDCYRSWRLIGDAISAIMALNFHTGFQDSQLPAQILELRRQAVSTAYALDKQSSTFVGRPPRLTKHFCVVEPPHDIPEWVFGAHPDAFEAARRALGPSGWNMDNKVYPGTSRRAMVYIYEVREMALELALRPTPDASEQQAQEVLRQSEAMWSRIPSMLNYDYTAWDTEPFGKVLTTLLVRMEYTYSEFLVYKMLVHQTGRYRDDCLRRAYNVLCMTLDAVKKEDTLTEHRVDIEWIVVYHAMPCVNVLILELYRHRTQQPQTKLAISSTALIIDLRTFISCCDWLSDPGHSNSEVCRQAQAIFKRALDFIPDPANRHAASWHTNTSNADKPSTTPQESLTTTTAPSEASTNRMVQNQPEAHEIPAFIDEDFAAWLSSYDVQMDSWLDGADILAANEGQLLTNGPS